MRNFFYHKFKSFFECILKIDHFRSITIESVKDVHAKSYSNIDDLKSLLGFAGKNKIFVNVQQFLEIKNTIRFKWCIDEQKEIVLSLEFVRLIFHETVHAVLYSNMNDLNLSSPLLKKQKS